MSENKMVRNSLTIALGIVCIILGGVIVAFGYYIPIINDKNSTIANEDQQKALLSLEVASEDSRNSDLHNALLGLQNLYDSLYSNLSSADSQISQLNSNITNLQALLDGNGTLLNQTQIWLEDNITAYNNYVNDHSYTNEQYQNLQNQITNLQNQVNNLTNIVNLANFTVVVEDKTVSQPAGGLGFANTNWTVSANYAGFVSVDVLSAVSTTYVELIYSSYGVNYDTQVNVGTSGTATFPVLPSSNILVEVGNKNLVGGATETVTIVYHY